MFDLPILGNAPARDPIEMVECLRAAIGDELGARRLEIAGIVRGAALQDGRSAGPVRARHEPRKRQSPDRCRLRLRHQAAVAVTLEEGDARLPRAPPRASRTQDTPGPVQATDR